ncbi:uncharacterized protein LOC130745451 [Lotus japonicus]|uniref:uncharacterized protein LOC130745451 n=1 Tax=Lotus japonicus TaxID=34305 RepID=UPI00258A85F4|nr:uncharacterized protein LOC130745451 [Lotus japonicus]XP_057453710.1 uncharacterized protein LOC130745451 [Lotus japonicus]XP_057453711.1 uncharacterized protein LOC130745451 [Lotus japonicus]
MIEKRNLWSSIEVWFSTCPTSCICIAGDFNAVRHSDERVGVNGVTFAGRRESEDFNSFIANLQLLDPPLVGGKYTWFRPNGEACSRLDRFLLSDDWASTWPNLAQYVLRRNYSDHCPILLKTTAANWGPKPFRVLKCWFQDPRFKPFVESSWSSLQIQGWGAFVVKEKLKGLRPLLKGWNKEIFGDINRKYSEILDSLTGLDQKMATSGLSSAEKDLRRAVQNELWQVARLRESILHQKSRCQWIKDGDSTSRFFHAYINRRRQINKIVGLDLNGNWEEEPSVVKHGIKSFFEQKFKCHYWNPPKLVGYHLIS